MAKNAAYGCPFELTFSNTCSTKDTMQSFLQRPAMNAMNDTLTNLYAKTSKSGGAGCPPLVLHMLDVAASADAILAREPESTRKRMATVLGMECEDARAGLLLVIACHDLGKACPGFQSKWKNLSGIDSGMSPNTEINHAF